MPPLLHVVLPIALAAAIPFLSTLIAKAGVFTAQDNKETRQWQSSLKGWRLRAYWAHLNALETFPMFAVAVVVAHLGAPGSTAAMVAAYAYPALRILYLLAFLADQGTLRSVVWFASMGAVLVLFACALVAAAPAAAQSVPAHCERATGAATWPAVGGPIDTTEPAPVTAAEAMQAVRAFRAAWRGVPHPSAVLVSFTQCMDASLEHFTVRRVSVAHARHAIEELAGLAPSMVLSGSARGLPTTGWVWEVYWGGASHLHPPSGPVSAYFSGDLTLLAAVQWLEG